jgi:hypothetical protein
VTTGRNNIPNRKLLDSGRRPPGVPARHHDPVVLDLIAELKADGNTW